jgi:hypothetical protein
VECLCRDDKIDRIGHKSGLFRAADDAFESRPLRECPLRRPSHRLVGLDAEDTVPLPEELSGEDAGAAAELSDSARGWRQLQEELLGEGGRVRGTGALIGVDAATESSCLVQSCRHSGEFGR